MKRIEWRLEKLAESFTQFKKRFWGVAAYAAVVAIGVAGAMILAGTSGVIVGELSDYYKQRHPVPGTPISSESPSRPVIIKSRGYDFAAQAVFQIRPAEGEARYQRTGGTGFLVRISKTDTVIMSNKHVCGAVIQESPAGRVMLHQGTRVWFSTVRLFSKLTDICIINVPREVAETAEPYEVAARPEASYVEGAALHVWGHPRLMPLTFVPARYINYTQDYFEQDLPATRGFGRLAAEIHPGNSGSPLLNSDGQVVGVIFAYERLPDVPPAGLFIPIKHAVDAATGQE